MTTRRILAPLLLTIGGLGGHATGFACEGESVGEGIGDLPRVIPAADIELLRDANGEVLSIRVSGGVRPRDDPNKPNAFIQEIKRKFGTKVNKYRSCNAK